MKELRIGLVVAVVVAGIVMTLTVLSLVVQKRVADRAKHSSSEPTVSDSATLERCIAEHKRNMDPNYTVTLEDSKFMLACLTRYGSKIYSEDKTDLGDDLTTCRTLTRNGTGGTGARADACYEQFGALPLASR